MLRPEGGLTVGRNAGGVKGEKGSQSVACPVYRAGYATRDMSIASARES